jgi:hypothetical protein
MGRNSDAGVLAGMWRGMATHPVVDPGLSLEPSFLNRYPNATVLLFMCKTRMFRRWPLALLVLATALGCSNSADEGPSSGSPEELVLIDGLVTLNGKPLPGAVVTFLPEAGGPGLGDTDEEGRFSLKSSGHPGVAPGKYKVGISYLAGPNGMPQRLADRSSIVQSDEMLAAKEQLPPDFSDLGRTKQSAEVSSVQKTVHFDIKAPDLVLTPPSAAAKKGTPASEENAKDTQKNAEEAK